MKRTIAVGIAASAMLVGPAALANAAEQPHKHATKAERKADRVHDRRVARRAANAAPKPAQGTTTVPTVSPTGAHNGPSTRHGVVSCAVTADRAGSSFVVTSTCDTAQTVTISVQSQPGPWHVGLCQSGGCHLLTRYDVQVPPGTHTITVATGGGCWVQVDLKWDGRLIRSNHYVKVCKPPVRPTPKPRPPVQTHPRIPGHVEGHLPSPTADLPRTGGVYTAGLEGGLGLLFLGAGLTVAARKRVTV